MYKFVKLKYKSIMINGEDKNSVEISAKATIHERNKQTHIYFESKEKVVFEIHFKENNLTLKQGNSALNFVTKETVENTYKTPYGALPLTTLLDVFEVKEDRLKIKYRLFQDSDCISNVYMQISWLPAR